MDNRERILELVSKGILSVEEGLNLLDNLAEQEAKKTEDHEFTSEQTEKADVKTEEVEEETDEIGEEPEKIEEELERLANQINQYSVGIDILNKELTNLKLEQVALEEEITDRKETRSEQNLQVKSELERKIIELNKEIALTTSTDESDSYLKIESLKQELGNTVEELSLLEKSFSTDEEVYQLENKLIARKEEIKKLAAEKNKQMKEMHSLKMKRWTNKAKQFSGNLEIPKEWRDGASETIDKAGEIIDSGSRTLTEFLREAVEKTKDTLENMDWKDMRFDLSGKETAAFEHEWLFEETTASIIDFKNAKGDIEFRSSMNDNIKVTAEIKIYGKIDEASPLEAFEARTVIQLDEESFTFHIPNKNIQAHLIVYLPKRDYDYVRLNTFAGDIQFDELVARDIYLKVTTGDIVFNHLEASMLEVKAANGDIILKDTCLRDLLLSSVNGDIQVDGAIQSLDIGTVNGDVRLTLKGEKSIRIAASSVNGDVKVSLPEKMSLEIEAKTTLGQVKSRLSGTEKSDAHQEKGQAHHFYRMADGELCRVKLQTTRGNILMKDTE